MPEQKFGFRHGTAETWIVAIAAAIVVALTGILFRAGLDVLNTTSTKVDSLERRFIAVETQVGSIHMQLVDVPNMKLEQARYEIRLKQLERSVYVNERNYP